MYNFASQSFVGKSWQQADYTANVTGLGALRVYEAVRLVGKYRKKDIRIYQASSSEQFGGSPAPQNESTIFDPRSPYAVAKVFAHNMAKVYKESYNMFISCGILFNHECVTAETPVFIRKNGIIDIFPIEDIVPHRTNYDGMKHTTEVDNSEFGTFDVWDRSGWAKVTCMTATWNGFDQSGRSYSKNKPVYRIVARGALFQVTGDHIVYTMNKNMDITESWDGEVKKDIIVGKPAWQIDLQKKPGDCLALIKLPEPTNVMTMTEDEAWLIGAMVSDGYIGISESKKYDSEKVNGYFSNKDIKLINNVKELWYKSTGEYTSIDMTYSSFTGKQDIYRLNLLGSSEYLRYLQRSIYTRSGYKRIPKRILNAPKNIRLSFLRGYNAGDGTKAVSDYEFQAATTNSATLAAGLYWLYGNTLDRQRCTIYDIIHNGETYYNILIGAPGGGKDSIGENMQESLEEIIRTSLVNYKGWVYDLATETGTFHAGIGQGWIHNSERRGIEFVTRKITDGVARIKLGIQNELRLGNLDAKRDWGYSKDYMEAVYSILNYEKPENFVIATGETHTVREFVDHAFSHVGLDWRDYVIIDKAFYRPADVVDLRGDYSKAKKVLGWSPKIDFKEMVEKMVDHDLKILKDKNNL